MPDDQAISLSFRLTSAFLSRHGGYRKSLDLTPENFRFDPVLWHSSVAMLRGMLYTVAEEEGLRITEADVGVAVRNLVEGIVAGSREWESE